MGRALRNMSLDEAVADATARYIEKNPRSMYRHQTACACMPGGNTRSILHYDPAPLTIAVADGCMIEDLDGHRYVDFLGEYSAGLYGHTNATIQEAITEAMQCGVVLGAPNNYEAKLAAEIVDRFPSVDLVRFCNSGSEANLMALSVARAVTGRKRTVGFNGAYHGGFLMLDTEHGALNAPYPIDRADYNDVDGAVAAIQAAGDDLAAVLMEPMIGAGGSIPATSEFLNAVAEEARAVGALLIFDEVITSRLSMGGLQAVTGITPDMTTLGKYLGGGLTFGAFGGRRDIMERFNPGTAEGFYHAGTFNNNVLTMAAGMTGLTKIYSKRVAHTLNAAGDDLRRRLNVCFKKMGLKAQVTGLGSIMTLHFTDRAISKPQDLADQDPRLKKLFHLAMLERGQYLAPRGMVSLSLPMGHPEYDGLVRAVEDFCTEYQPLLKELCCLKT